MPTFVDGLEMNVDINRRGLLIAALGLLTMALSVGLLALTWSVPQPPRHESIMITPLTRLAP